MYGILWRTVKPFEAFSPQGCHKPTSRSQTKMSLWSLDFYNSVIPRVPFIWWVTPFLISEVRSLEPTYVFARLIRLTIKRTFILTLYDKNFYRSSPFVLLRYLLEEFRPKQTTRLSLSLKYSCRRNLRIVSHERFTRAETTTRVL